MSATDEQVPAANTTHQRAVAHRNDALRWLEKGNASAALVHALLSIEARLEEQTFEMGAIEENTRAIG